MIVHIETLYHFTCDHCKLAWAIADREVKQGVYVVCPKADCGKASKIEGLQSHPLEPLFNVALIPDSTE